MDVRILRPGSPNRSYKIFDRLNSWSGFIPCSILESIGWYSGSISKRLLGQYRLFQLFSVLQDFLTNSQSDFESAYKLAIEQITDPRFFTTEPYPTASPEAVPTPIQGKEKGVFSKKQVLILFDLLSTQAGIERIDLNKPNKFEAIAGLLHALTGKTTNTWLEELDKYRNKDLYAFHKAGERDQLIVILTNLAETFRKAGFRSIANLADKKMKELEAKAIL